MALVWSGVSRCLVSGTSLPSIRARNTSPALMWRSEAPRSMAALMICSMPRCCVAALARPPFALSSTRLGPPLVSGLGVDRVGERGPCKIATDVLHDQPRLTVPEPRGDRGHMRADEHARVPPQGMPSREWLGGEHVERRATETGSVEQIEQRRLVQQGPASDVDHHRIGWQPLEHGAGHGTVRLRSMGRGDDEAVALRGEPGQVPGPTHPTDAGGAAPLRPAAHAGYAHPQRQAAPRDRDADPAETEHAQPDLPEFTHGNV